MRYLIIGNSTAGIATIEGIRSLDTEGDITVVTEEPYKAYSRPLISYLLLGKTDLNRMRYRDDSFYEKNKVKLITGTKVVSLDSVSKKAILSDGNEIFFDKCMVATGSVPFVPPMNGIAEVKNKFDFLKLSDALALEKKINKETQVLIIGAGLIGLKCAEGISKAAGKITVVDIAPRILSSILDDECAAMVQKTLSEHKIDFILSDSVDKFEEDRAYLNSGKEIHFDVLVVAIGVRPNVELIKNAGGEINRGVLINDYMQTSLTDIYSAGDCSEGYDSSIDGKRILALLPNAYMQGECAGRHMTEKARESLKPYRTGIPMNSIGFFGTHIATCGSYQGTVYEEKDDKHLKKMFYEDNLLKGYIIIGDIDKVGIYTNLIRNKIPMDSDMKDEILKKPGLISFSKTYRKEKLASQV